MDSDYPIKLRALTDADLDAEFESVLRAAAADDSKHLHWKPVEWCEAELKNRGRQRTADEISRRVLAGRAGETP